MAWEADAARLRAALQAITARRSWPGFQKAAEIAERALVARDNAE